MLVLPLNGPGARSRVIAQVNASTQNIALVTTYSSMSRAEKGTTNMMLIYGAIIVAPPEHPMPELSGQPLAWDGPNRDLSHQPCGRLQDSKHQVSQSSYSIIGAKASYIDPGPSPGMLRIWLVLIQISYFVKDLTHPLSHQANFFPVTGLAGRSLLLQANRPATKRHLFQTSLGMLVLASTNK